jgi:CHAD domain-containing protein
MDGADPLQPVVAASTARLTKDISAHDALQIVARDCIAQITVSRASLGAGSPESLHQVRVALRRWRTALTVFSALLTEEGRELPAELKWLAGQLNAARDLDVFAPKLEARRAAPDADTAALDELSAALEAAMADAYRTAGAALKSDRAKRLLWEGLRPVHSATGPIASQAPRARDIAARALKRRRRQLDEDGPRLSGLDTEGRHRLRIRAKKLRYAAELFGPLFGHPRRHRRFVASLKAMQDALGELNDLCVGQALAQKLALQTAAPGAAFEAGLIAGGQTCVEAGLLRQAERAYRRLAGVEGFW